MKITDVNNPIVTETTSSGNYFGCSWTDIDNDGKLDLYINKSVVFKNTGGGNFVKLNTAMPNQNGNLGNSWADYNNDGFIDCFVVSTGGSFSYLYKNEGNGIMNKVLTGVIADSSYNTGWGCSWADYDNDGFADLFITAANNFGVVNHSNRFYHNNGDGTFDRLTVHGITDTLGPFTIPTWSDYDQDGDVDLFIGTGPGGSTSQDYIYKNMLTETGTANLVRLYQPPLTTDLHDGQNWNLIDYDNDGDLDAYITNYANNVPNNLYKNNNGVYEKMTSAQVGNIVSDLGMFLTNLWGDFDNDGDLDCFVTRESAKALYYSNNGNGTFTRNDSLAIVTAPATNFGATAGDYDNNGSLDLYVTGTTSSKGLYRNDLSNGNKWINIKCSGNRNSNTSLSNASALGTKIKAKAVINGVPVWQFREINAQNSFNSMNMLNVHFGFGNATAIDSLIIIWPRGLRETITNVQLNGFYNAVEGQGIVSGIESEGNNSVPEGFNLYQNYPNPFNPVTKIKYELKDANYVSLTVFDILGNEVRSLVKNNQPAGSYEVTFDGEGLSSGIYFYKIDVSSNQLALNSNQPALSSNQPGVNSSNQLGVSRSNLSAGRFSETKMMTLLK
ncbi:MAG TPA: FG-GAP-like repeat-containing protein [Ignavibacteria bacterium]|nr:FG-GAP-like repeat-containing protein [Ignavibacteria bacterium]